MTVELNHCRNHSLAEYMQVKAIKEYSWPGYSASSERQCHLESQDGLCKWRQVSRPRQASVNHTS